MNTRADPDVNETVRSTKLPIGTVTSVRGSDVRLTQRHAGPTDRARITVGTFVGIPSDASYIVGMITGLSEDARSDGQTGGRDTSASLDLLGEILTDSQGVASFRRGVRNHPAIGDVVETIGSREVQLVYHGSDKPSIEIGRLHQDPSVPGVLNVQDLLTKHFAVLGTTGVGKSTGVAVILRQILEAQPETRILLLDGHNEYGRCFGDKANIISPRTLKLPFWLFNLEEFVDVIYGGRPSVPEEVDILAELIPLAKSMYGQYKGGERLQLRRDPKISGFTVDTPVPYLLQDLLGLIDERMGRLDNRSMRMVYHRLATRIETLRNDPRYAFMFQNANVGGDTMGELLMQLFRLEPDGKPMSVIQLAGLPVEVVDAVVCVLCGLAFNFGMWSEGAVPLLFVCEEAHRFASVDPAVSFHPTRRALSRIAKEGRKHGIYLGLVTQRPAELDPTIISQCSTLLAMRMANERDQALLRSAVSDSAANLLPFIPSLSTREVICFGEGVPLPVRMTFNELPAHLIPRADSHGSEERTQARTDRDFVQVVLDRWRGATMSTKAKPDDMEQDQVANASVPLARVQSSLEQTRNRLLKRPLDTVEPASASAGSTRHAV